MKMHPEIVIKTINLTKTYNGVSALNNLNLLVKKHSRGNVSKSLGECLTTI
jgi:hypothetical protein